MCFLSKCYTALADVPLDGMVNDDDEDDSTEEIATAASEVEASVLTDGMGYEGREAPGATAVVDVRAVDVPLDGTVNDDDEDDATEDIAVAAFEVGASVLADRMGYEGREAPGAIAVLDVGVADGPLDGMVNNDDEDDQTKEIAVADHDEDLIQYNFQVNVRH
jgi:hypothetical protein